jgi:hypothetical protein
VSHVFFIPTQTRYWRRPAAADPVGTLNEKMWSEIEAKRVIAMAARLFPQVVFELCREPPRSQIYEAGSVNAEIRDFLQSRTSLRL